MESRFELRTLYIQKNVHHYLDKFGMMEATNTKTSWNWCAFLFTSAWLLYRKMYKPAIFFMVIEFILIPFLSFRLQFIPVPLTMSIAPLIQGIDLLLSIGVNILLGITGNYIYMKHIDGLIDKENSLTGGESRFAFQQKYGGVSWNLIAVYLIIAIALSTAADKFL